MQSPDPDDLFKKHQNFTERDTFVLETEGFYAFKDISYGVNEYDYVIEYPVCFGTVELWGSVIEHEYGYRAQYAKIHSLDWINQKPTSLFDNRLVPLRTLYGVN